MTRRSTPLPSGLARMPLRVFRPQDVAHVYAFPRPELARLADAASCIAWRAATTPWSRLNTRDRRGGQDWRPPRQVPGRSTVPRTRWSWVSARRACTVCCHELSRRQSSPYPTSIGPIDLVDRDAVIRFVQRDTEQLDAELVSTQMGRYW